MRRAAFAVAAGLAVAWPASAAAHDPGAYRWVGDDEAPASRRAELDAGVTEVWTGDLQAVVSLAPGEAEAGTAVELRPRSTAGLAPLPADRYAGGNVYAVAVDPPSSAAGGRLLLAVPHEATAVLFSVDGGDWRTLAADPVAPGQVAAPLVGGGLYLAVGDHDLAGAAGGGGTSSTLRTGVVAGGPAVLVALLAVARGRRREAPEPVGS